MSIMRQSSKAQDRTLGNWIQNIQLTYDFNAILSERAKLVVVAMSALTEGNHPVLDRLWMAHLGNTETAEAAV